MAMRIHHPTTIDEAIHLLAADDEARCLAGGQTLVAMMNLGLAEPSALVSLRGIAGLDAIEPGAGDATVIGASVTQAALADATFAGAQSVVTEAARQVAHPAIRNFGTVGGGLCHADPAGDLPPAFVAADAVFAIAGPEGARDVPAADFFVDYLTTCLETGEILKAIRLPAPPPASAGIYDKFARVDGDYATVSVAVTLAMDGGTCAAIRMVLGSCAPTPLWLADADARLVGGALSDDDVAAAARLLQDAADPLDDVRGSADYRRRIIPGLLARAVARARSAVAAVGP